MPKVTGEDLMRLARDAKRIRLRGIRLSESSCKLGAFKEGKLPTHAAQAINMELQTDKEGKQVKVRIMFRLIVTYGGPEDAEPPLSIAAAFVLQYAVEKRFPKKNLEQAVRGTAMMMTWPYWREFVQSMTVRMGLPAFPVPLLNVTDLESNQGATEGQKPS